MSNLHAGFVLFGYDQGVMSGIITAPAFNNLFKATKGNSTMQGFVTAIYEIGMISVISFFLWIPRIYAVINVILTELQIQDVSLAPSSSYRSETISAAGGL